MVIAFLHARQSPQLAEIMVASCRRHMPNVPLIQLTDEDTPAIEGCGVWRRRWDDRVMLWRMLHLTGLEGDVCVLDTDVVVQDDLQPVFARWFDVALTRRHGPILDPQGVDVAKLMPFNCGVMFCRKREFWRECAELMQKMPEEACRWWGDQIAVKHLAPKFNTLVLECDEYNYTPTTAAEDVSMRKVVHYKGQRKEWMLRRGDN